jgi:Protein phosphatase 2C
MEKISSVWRCTGKSVKGASHVRNELPNQDAIKWHPDLGEGLPIIVAVSDGHGSAKNFRSDRGSQLAVKTTTAIVQNFLTSNEAIEAKVKELPKLLVDEWKKRVMEDWENNPFQDIEYQRLIKKEGEIAKLTIEKNPVIAYGATLLAVVVTEFFILYLQLGDGDILCVDSSNQVSSPIKPDPRLIANETTSLCMEQAEKEFRFEFESYPQGIPDNMPSLILISTDGYANSFPSDTEFQKIGRDYRQMIQEQGIKNLEEQLEKLLGETSRSGSGDDITLGIIKQIEPIDRDYEPIDLNKDVPMESAKKDTSERVSDLKNSSLSTNILIVTCLLTALNIVLNIGFFFYLHHQLELGQKKVQTSHSEEKVGRENPPEGERKINSPRNRK